MAGERVVTRVSLAEKLARVNEQWAPKTLGQLNGQLVKVAKFRGEFVWHRHEAEDELFLVLQGRLTIRLEGGEVRLGPGEFAIVPRGVPHQPVAEEGEAHVLLFEPASTVNTGDAGGERTVPGEWI